MLSTPLVTPLLGDRAYGDERRELSLLLIRFLYLGREYHSKDRKVPLRDLPALSEGVRTQMPYGTQVLVGVGVTFRL